MDKSEILKVLAPYCPPLSASQLEAIATEIVEISEEEIRRLKPGRKKSRNS